MDRMREMKRKESKLREAQVLYVCRGVIVCLCVRVRSKMKDNLYVLYARKRAHRSFYGNPFSVHPFQVFLYLDAVLCTQEVEDLHKEMADLLFEIKERADDIETHFDELEVHVCLISLRCVCVCECVS